MRRARQDLARISSACRTLGSASLGQNHRVLPWDPRISFYSAAGNSAIISDLNVRGANWLIFQHPRRRAVFTPRDRVRMFSFRARSRCLVFADRAPAAPRKWFSVPGSRTSVSFYERLSLCSEHP